MISNRVSAQLSDNDRDAALAAIATIRDRLPFLIQLTPDERASLPRMGAKSRTFVRKALDVAVQDPDFMPRAFDIDEMRQDVELFESLYPVLTAISELQELISDTCIAAGSDAYAAALMIYNFARLTGQGPQLDSVVDEVGQRIARKSAIDQPQPAIAPVP